MSAQNREQRSAYMKPRIRFPFFDGQITFWYSDRLQTRVPFNFFFFRPRLSVIRPNRKRKDDRIATKFDTGECYQNFSVNASYYNLTITETLHEHVPVFMCAL